MIVGNIYRPPRILYCDYKVFIDEFASVLSHIDFKKYEVIIDQWCNWCNGDININLLKSMKKSIVVNLQHLS